MTTAYVTDIAVHAGIGTLAACTNGCVRHFCKHRIKQYGIAGVLILGEAAATVAVIG